MTHHFSPRPNRAAEIGWLEWSDAAFERARELDRPILLGISAVWCHWCHVMDETTYSDSRAIELIREKFVPVRVDNDRRPDINARYNMGGWPTTAFLSPDGEVLYGATYVPPDNFVQLLRRLDQVWNEERDEIEKSLAERKPAAAPAPGNAAPGPEAVERVLHAIVSQYDEEHGGFGTEPKFPQPDALRFLLLEYRRHHAAGRTDERLYGILARTALAMARGGMYDRVEGGFFRYSTTRDWSIPHFEKMAEDHAGLLRFYAELYRATGNAAFAQTLRSALRWLRTVMLDPQTGLFAGSQDADEEYFALPLDERRRRTAPYVDRTVYTNWNAGLAAALLAAGLALDDDTLVALAVATLDALERDMRAPDGTLLHYKIAGEEAKVGPLLTDHAALLEASLDAHAVTGEPRFLQRASALADAALQSLRDGSGAFLDARQDPGARGNLRKPHYPPAENGTMADGLLRLSALLHDERYASAAREALAALHGTASRYGSHAANYARAVVRSLAEAPTVTVVSASAQGAALREAAVRLADPLVDVRTIDPSDSGALAQTGFLSSDRALAYPCIGTRCGAPAENAAQLSESYDMLRQLPVR